MNDNWNVFDHCILIGWDARARQKNCAPISIQWSSTFQLSFITFQKRLNSSIRSIQSKSFNSVGRNISAQVGCIKKLRALYEVQLLETYKILRLNVIQLDPEKSSRDQSWKNPKQHPENGIFHPMISWVYNNHCVILIFHLVFLWANIKEKTC